MAEKIYIRSANPTNPPVNVLNTVSIYKEGFTNGAKIVFTLTYNNRVEWKYADNYSRDAEFETLADLESCCSSGGGGTSELSELLETFEGLISGTSVTITNFEADDIIMVYRNGLLKRPGYDYNRIGAVITFFTAFSSSTGSLGDGESVTIISLRQS